MFQEPPLAAGPVPGTLLMDPSKESDSEEHVEAKKQLRRRVGKVSIAHRSGTDLLSLLSLLLPAWTRLPGNTPGQCNVSEGAAKEKLSSTTFMLIASGRAIPPRPLCPRKSLGPFMAADSIHLEAPFWNVLLPLPVVYSCINNEEQLKDCFLLFLITNFQLGVKEAPVTSPRLRDERRPLCPCLEGAGKPSRDTSLLYETGLPANSGTLWMFFREISTSVLPQRILCGFGAAASLGPEQTWISRSFLTQNYGPGSSLPTRH
ncbi:uncharacterized protein LOC113996400 [Pipra filicauda]|uniref:Uncharacterized protein LOC113996400 n=1 Tax=Pipra filicauda TaxID=649802 RepID=A0A7R5KRU5_9PASS|nr:uncharacterized protein LOC113996400 [Pipra filicauda]